MGYNYGIAGSFRSPPPEQTQGRTHTGEDQKKKRNMIAGKMEWRLMSQTWHDRLHGALNGAAITTAPQPDCGRFRLHRRHLLCRPALSRMNHHPFRLHLFESFFCPPFRLPYVAARLLFISSCSSHSVE
jgi:hypothetical protein